MSRKEQAAASRAELVEAARACFAERGYEDTTVAAILERAGMARGALYHYFPAGKQEIFIAVFDAMNDRYHARRDAARQLPTALARLRAGIGAFLEQCTDDAFMRIVVSDAPFVVPGQDQRGSSYELLLQQVREAMAEGDLRRGDVDAIALSLYGAVRGAGEYVAVSPQGASALRTATKTINALVDGLMP